MKFFTRPIDGEDTQAIAGWRYAAPYDVYDERGVMTLTGPHRALCDENDVLCGYFCWAHEAQIPAANDLYAREEALDFGIQLRPDLTGHGLGQLASGCALAWLRHAFAPPAFRLAVYEWNTRARQTYERLGFAAQTVRGGFVMMKWDVRPWQEASRPLENGIAVYPSDPSFDRHLYHHKEKCGWDVSIFSMSAHTGTHIDAPAHLGMPGDTTTIPLERLNGTVQLLAFSGAEDAAAVKSPYVLLQTGGRGLTLPEAEALVRVGVLLIGLDGMSVGGGADEMPVHRLLMENGITILENAAIEAFAPGWYDMRCLPLLMPGSDGAPVRLQLRAKA